MQYKDIYLSALTAGVEKSIDVVQNDSARSLHCYTDIDLSSITSARIYIKKPDGTEVFNACVIGDEYITVPLSSQTISVLGNATAQLYCSDEDGYITTFKFGINVVKSHVSSGAVESANEYGALGELLKKADAQIVSSKSEMTDHDKIYFLSTDGHYYYWSDVDDDFVKTSLSYADIVDNLTSTDSTKVLSAKQGNTLKGLIDNPAVATTSRVGVVKPDGTTITVDSDGTIRGAQTYQLPTASGTVKGGIKVGANLTMNGEVMSVNKATTQQLGVVKPDGTTVTIDGDGTIHGAQTYVLPTATEDTLGGIKVGSGLEIDEDGILDANIPEEYIKSVSVDGKDIVFTTNDDTNIEYEPSVYTKYETDDLLDDKADDNRVTAIEGKIPTQASSSNKLADKEFVNSSIGTNTANYISDNGNPFTSLAALEAYTGTVTNNDYAFITGTDTAGNTYFDRYKATVSGSSVSWAKEYRLNNSSFTAVQWSAINSGLSSSDKTKLDGVEENANNYSLPTATSSTKGGIKIGSNLSMSGDVLSVNKATTQQLGVVKPDGTTVTIDSDGVIHGAQTYSLPTASASTKGGIKIGDNLHMNGDVLSAEGGVSVGNTAPSDMDVWIDTDEEGADFCYVGDTEPPNDGSVAVWVDTSEDERVSTIEVGDTTPTDDNVQIWVDTSAGANLADYIVEQGTSGIWTYRKWNSGVVECWGQELRTDINIGSVEGSGYFALIKSTSFPTNLFIGTPIYCNVSVMSNSALGLIAVTPSNTTAINVSYYVWGTKQYGALASIRLGFIVKGRWK